MKIRTRELIIRLTAAGIGFALTGAVFHIAAAHSHEATIVVQPTRSERYEMRTEMKEPGCMVRPTTTSFLPSVL
jgi:hypothetical protein